MENNSFKWMVSGKGDKHMWFHGTTGKYKIAIKQAHISDMEQIGDFIHICINHDIKPKTYLHEQNVPVSSLKSIFVHQNCFIRDFVELEHHIISLQHGQQVTFYLTNNEGWYVNGTFKIELHLIQE